MKNKIVDLEKNILIEIINKIYKCFLTDPYEFEYFCKLFFYKEGFDEIEVTRRTKDGGVDLKAIKKGYDENGVDTINYKIQAKRLKPSTSVSVKDVRELKGVLEGHEKGIFITTSKYSKDALEFANSCNPKCLILIDGLNIARKCIELQIGFLYEPIFDEYDLMKSLNKYKQSNIQDNVCNESFNMSNNSNILKVISLNDIKTRILPIPKGIFDKIPNEINSFNVNFNNNDELKLKINRDRRYFGGITEIYRKYGLIDDDNNSISRQSYWSIDEKNKVISVVFKN